MYLLQGQRLDRGEGGAAADEDEAEVRAAGFGSSSAPATHPHRVNFFFSESFLAALFVDCSLTYFLSACSSFLSASCLSSLQVAFILCLPLLCLIGRI